MTVTIPAWNADPLDITTFTQLLQAIRLKGVRPMVFAPTLEMYVTVPKAQMATAAIGWRANCKENYPTWAPVGDEDVMPTSPTDNLTATLNSAGDLHIDYTY